MFPNALFDQINKDISEYEDVFDVLMKWAYFITLPIVCLFCFWQIYLPVIWNKLFNQPATVQFANADASWGFWQTFFYKLMHPPMDMAETFNRAASFGDYCMFFLLPMPIYVIIYSITFAIVMAVIYRTIWNTIIGPTIGDYLRPIVDSACKNIK